MILPRPEVRQRLATGIAVGAFHLAAIYGLIAAFAGGLAVPGLADKPLLSVFAARPRPKPLPPHDPGGPPRSAAKRAEAAPVLAIAPPARPSPMPAAPFPAAGQSRSTGAAETGEDGSGSGHGGGSGEGSGDGEDGGSDLRLISGGIYEEDYPREAVRLHQSGKVYIRFAVGADGRVSQCTVTRSSGSPSLDSATCRLILRRFRYGPSRDAAGRPHGDVVEGVHQWRIGGRIEDDADDAEGEDLATSDGK